MEVFEDAVAMRAWSRERRRDGKRIGFVPTMGALHEEHLSLIRRSVDDNEVTVASLFVNPAQFGPNEDYDRYPRTWEEDARLMEDAGVDAVYVPHAAAMYPDGYSTYINVEQVSDGLCSVTRPGFFRGVATVVAKLFNAVDPDRAYFGQKDAQQAAVIRRMTRDLDFGIAIEVLPIVRETDGLALSSRNRYLSEEQRDQSLSLAKGLRAAETRLLAGERSALVVKQAVSGAFHDSIRQDYVAVVDAETMEPVECIERRVVVAIAAYVGETRLIDNIVFDPLDSTIRHTGSVAERA